MLLQNELLWYQSIEMFNQFDFFFFKIQILHIDDTCERHNQMKIRRKLL